MTMTSDGIAKADWDKLHDLALALVNSPDEHSADRIRERLLHYLDSLFERYGERPSLLATRADYVDDEKQAEQLLIHAMRRATEMGDETNRKHIALSLADLYLTSFEDLDAASHWLAQIETTVHSVGDSDDRAEFARIADAVEQSRAKHRIDGG